MRASVLAAVALTACIVPACATTRAVPRPFPGAATPPGATATAPPAAGATPDTTPSLSATRTISPLLTTALGLTGTPYRNGGSTPAGFDCSGFVQYVFARHGQSLPREVQAQYKVGDKVDRSDVRAGDLVFFETVSRGASHVGIATGDGQFVHAPSSKGVVRVERFTSDYWAKRWVGARRVHSARVATGAASGRESQAAQ